MTIKEIYEEEQNNSQSIIFHKEGLFWRAYERSAYAVIATIREFKATYKQYKVIQNRYLVYIGIPEKTLNAVTATFKCDYADETKRIFALKTLTNLQNYNDWKEALAHIYLSIDNNKIVNNNEVLDKHELEGNQTAILSAIRGFDMANKTPIECMLFLANIQKRIKSF